MEKAKKPKEKKEDCVVRTLKFKVRPQGYNFLNLAAIEINQIWNYCNQVSHHAIKPYFGKPKYLSGFDLNKLLSGCTKSKQNPGYSHILADGVQLTAQEYAIRRNQFKKSKLRFRKSFGTNKSLGWIPLKRLSFQIKQGQKLQNGGIVYKGKSFPLYNFEYLRFNLDILKGKLKQGSFSQDSLGDWYFNIVCETPKENFEAWLFDLNHNSNQYQNIRDILKQELLRQDVIQNSEQEDQSLNQLNPSIKNLIPGRKNPWNQIGREDVIGLDPGVASLATDSLGVVYEAFRGYRKAQEKLAKAQGKGDKQQVKFLSKKIKNQRLDYIHKLSNEILNSAQTIKIGKVNLKEWVGKKDKSNLIKNPNSNQDLKIDIKDLVEQPSLYIQKNKETSTQPQKVNSGDENNSKQNLNDLTKAPASLSISKGLGHGKAVLDSGLGMLKAFLFYKGNDAGRRVVEVCEKYSTQMCSNCFELTGPKGHADLNVRKWTCPGCGINHQRDENAAVNISRILEDLGLMESIKKWKEMHCKTFFSKLFFEDDLNLTQMELKVLLPRCRQIELNLKGKDKDLNSREMGKKFTA